jgi:hypothetical protein
MRKTFIYTQTRLQARHGMRPDEHTWQSVESKKDLANYLQAARQTPLKNWVAGLQATDDHHVIETTLVKLYREYILDVARWIPPAWRESAEWTVALIYLPAILHLLRGNTARNWMLEIPELKSLTMSNLDLRMEAFARSPYAPLLDAWQTSQSLVFAWLAQWRLLWPDKHPRQTAPLNELVSVAARHIETFHQLALNVSWRQRQQLAVTLTLMFRKHAFQPAAVFIHLLLVALDMERLRGSVMQRALFPGYREESS